MNIMAVKPEKIVIGTRGSALAVRQAQIAANNIVNIGYNTLVEIREIKTSGDWHPSHGEVKLDCAKGGKALFAKEIEEALLDKEIDIAVHSLKDLETAMPRGLILPWVLRRGDAGDAFLSRDKGVVHLRDLPEGAVVGTASIRRQAYILRMRPDLKIVTIRGNVGTRLKKLEDGKVDAMFLAIAGLERLGLEAEASCILPPEEMLPAACQGILGLQIREDDLERLSYISQINCYKTFVCATAEREVLHVIGGSCHTPIGVYATYQPDESENYFEGNGDAVHTGGSGLLEITAQLILPDGSKIWEQRRSERVLGLEEARSLGHSVGADLKKCAPVSLL